MNDLPIPVPILIAFIFLILISIIDIWRHEVPAIITTSFIIIMLFAAGIAGLFSSLMMGLFGWLMIELKFFEGGADLKVMAALGTLTQTYSSIVIFVLIFMAVGIIYSMIIKHFINKNLKEVPFTPVFIIPLLILTLGGMI